MSNKSRSYRPGFYFFYKLFKLIYEFFVIFRQPLLRPFNMLFCIPRFFGSISWKQKRIYILFIVNHSVLIDRLTRVEPRYGLARRLFPSALHSFLKGDSLSANSCFTEWKKSTAQTSRNQNEAEFLIRWRWGVQIYCRISSDESKSGRNYAHFGVTGSTLASLWKAMFRHLKISMSE